MTLTLSFFADTSEEARSQARAWIAAEPHVESGTIEDVTAQGRRYVVTVKLVLRPTEQRTLGLVQ